MVVGFPDAAAPGIERERGDVKRGGVESNNGENAAEGGQKPRLQSLVKPLFAFVATPPPPLQAQTQQPSAG